MKLAIDLRPLQIGYENRDLGSYLINLLRNLPIDNATHFIYLRYDTSNPLIDYSLPIPSHYSEVIYKKRNFSKKPLSAIRFVLGQMTPKYLRLIAHRPDVFMQPDYLLGAPRLPGTRVVVICYDIIPLKFRTVYLPSWRHYWRMRHFSLKARIRLSLRSIYHTHKHRTGANLLKRSDKILSVSRTTENDLVELLGISSGKIQIIYPAPTINEINPSKNISSLIKSLTLPYLLFMGGADRSKRVYDLVYSFNKLRALGVECSLVLSGNEFTKGNPHLDSRISEAIRLSSYKRDIHLTGPLSEGDKYLLLEHASCFVYPSIYDGFGMPVLEALTLDLRVVAYRNSALEEIADGRVIFTDSLGSDSLTHEVKKALSGENISQKNGSDIEEFNWKKTASLTWDVLSQQKHH